MMLKVEVLAVVVVVAAVVVGSSTILCQAAHKAHFFCHFCKDFFRDTSAPLARRFRRNVLATLPCCLRHRY